MKITVEHREGGENEVVLRCAALDDEMLRVLALLRSGLQKLWVWTENRETLSLSPGDVVYGETVEDRTFLYTRSAMYQTALGLGELESRYGELGIFRVGKSVVVNLHHIRSLRSCPGGRIERMMTTGEKVVVSRHYAPLLREVLGLERSEVR